MRIELVEELTEELSEAMAAAVSDAVIASAARIEGRAKEMAPVDTGNLRNSIQHRQTGRFEAEVAAHAEYAAAVEFGTGVFSTDPKANRQPIEIRPRQAKALYWPGAKHPVRRVRQLGQPPRPYMVPAAEEERQRFAAAVAKALRETAGE